MVIIPSHTSHAFQPLNVACFKPFQIVYRKERNATMVSNNNSKPDKITLVAWVDKALDQTLVKKNIISRFKVTGIWPLNSKAMDEKTIPSTLYTLGDVDRTWGDDGESNENNDGDFQWVEHSTTTKLINIATTLEPTCEISQVENVTQNIPRYYVFVLRNPIVQNSRIVVEPSNMVVNIHDDVMLDVMTKTTPSTLLSQ